MTMAIRLRESICKNHGGVWARAAAERDLDETFVTPAEILAEGHLIDRIRHEEADPYKALRLEVQLYRDVLEAISPGGRGDAPDPGSCAAAALLANRDDLAQRNAGRRPWRPAERKATGIKMLDGKGHAWTLLPWEKVDEIAPPGMFWRRYWRTDLRLLPAAIVINNTWQAMSATKEPSPPGQRCAHAGAGKRAADAALIKMATA
jgi:hypothetical protein